MYLLEQKKCLQELGIVSPDSILPCSETEVAAFEVRIGKALPLAYREFLLWCGHGAGSFLKGSHCFFEHLPLLETWSQDLLAENEFPQQLPGDAFVFFMHQGYQFDFFRFSEGENPPVYYFLEGSTKLSFQKVYDKYSDFISAMIDTYARSLPS